MTDTELLKVEYNGFRAEDILFWCMEDERFDDMPSPGDMPVSTLLAFLNIHDYGTPAKLDLDLLRGHIEWAEKSAALGSFNGVRWNQARWATAYDVDPDLYWKADFTKPDSWGELQQPDFLTLSKEAVKEGFCDTAGCLAGNIAMERGDLLWTSNGSELDANYVMDEDAHNGLISIEKFAARELGTSSVESHLLFAGGNTIPELSYFATGFADRRGLTF